MFRRAILVDVTKCIGCGSCVEACQKTNRQPAHEAKGFDESSFTYLMDRGSDVYVRRLCMHCEQPTCVSVCPVGALRKTPGGPVTYDPQRCMGCRYCMMACPFGVPTYEWHSVMPRVRKCEMCASRGEAGPACAQVCPTGATKTGERGALIEEARSRLAADPKGYYPHIFGLAEAGGTDVLYIGARSPAELGLPVLPVVESWFSRRAFGKPLETQLLSRMSRVSVIVLALYLVLRLRDLGVRGAFAELWAFTPQSWIFLAEVGLGVAVPMVLLASSRFRSSPRRLATAQGLVVLGFIFNRLNVSVTAIEAATGKHYMPAIPEFVASMGLVALGMTLFMLACRYLPVFPEGALADREHLHLVAEQADERPQAASAG